MATMKAAILSSHSEPLSIKDVPIPVPSPGEITVKVLVFYLLPYTKNIMRGMPGYDLPLPMTPGGSCIGRVHAAGPDTTALKEGQLVFCDPTIRARDDASAAILMGITQGLTEGGKKLMENVWRNGCMAEYVKMPLENVYPMDEEILLGSESSPGAFELTDLPLLQTCMIPFGGLDDAGLKVGDTVIVAPATGRFGGAAVMVALARGAKVVALGRDEEKLEKLKESFPYPGLLTMKLESDEEKDTTALTKVLKGQPADIYIDFSPGAAAAGGKTPAHVPVCIHTLKSGGTVALMGGIFGKIEISYMEMVLKNLQIKGKFMYDREQVQQIIKMAETGHFKLLKNAGLKVITFKLDQIEEALEVASQNPGFGTRIAVTP